MAKYATDKKRLVYSSSQEFYDLQACRGATDEAFNIKSKPHIAVDVKRLMKHISGSSKILDAGCRDAWALGYLAKKGFTNVHGFDVIKENVSICRKHGYNVLKANAEDLVVYDTSSFDAVFARHMLEHVVNPRKAIAEFARILRKGGIFYCIIPLQNQGTTPKIKYGHSYVFYNVDELYHMSSKFFREISRIKREHSKSGLAATFVGKRK
jgi:ubiquinone/menaquinone biosynthesis C-methylase UbiE